MSSHKPTVFRGIATALITPLRDGRIDREALFTLIDAQIQGGVDAILVAGTTGETSTLSFDEHGELISLAKEAIGGRVPLLAGCGSNCTSRACELARIACSAGADGLLAVTPYYNKASDDGLLLHYQAIAKAATKPLIVYNVPSRTGVNLQMKHYRELAKIDGIVGVKEASGNLSLLEELCTVCKDDLDVYTGNDDQIVASMRLGAAGAISVLSNVYPKATAELFRLCTNEDWRQAEERMQELRPVIGELFREVNPIPVKYLAHLMGYCEAEYRLPLCSPSPETQRRLEDLLVCHPNLT